MGRYNVHPAQGGGHYHEEKIAKDRRETFEQIQYKKKLKRLKKLRKKGGK